MNPVQPSEVIIALLSNPSVMTSLKDASQLIEASFGLTLEINDAIQARKDNLVLEEV